VPVPLADIKRGKESEALWESHVRSALQAKVIPFDSEVLTQELQARIKLAEELLPMPPKGEEGGVEEEKSITSVSCSADVQPKSFYQYLRRPNSEE
jgi:hypothetical protein